MKSKQAESVQENDNVVIYRDDGKYKGTEKKHLLPQKNSRVYIKSIKDAPRRAILDGIEKINAAKLINESDTVAIKINIGGGITGLPGTYSEPGILEEIILAIRELGGNPLVCEANMRGRIISKSLLKQRGYGEILARTGTRFLNLSDTETVELKCIGVDIPLLFPRILLQPETCVLSYAPIKYHWECGVTLSQKNMYGALAEGNKSIYHADVTLLDKVIAAASRVMSPSVNILGGRILSSGIGPHFSVPIDFNYLIFSRDPWAGDKVASGLMDYPYEKVRYAMFNSKEKDIPVNLLAESDNIPDELINKVRKHKINFEDTIFWRNFLALQYHTPFRLQRIMSGILEPPFALLNKALFSWRGKR